MIDDLGDLGSGTSPASGIMSFMPQYARRMMRPVTGPAGVR